MNFFFQAEDGIRDADVTGVQTCALPIYQEVAPPENPRYSRYKVVDGRLEMKGKMYKHCYKQWSSAVVSWDGQVAPRSEERRVGKECRSRWSPDHEKKNSRRQRNDKDEHT